MKADLIKFGPTFLGLILTIIFLCSDPELTIGLMFTAVIWMLTGITFGIWFLIDEVKHRS